MSKPQFTDIEDLAQNPALPTCVFTSSRKSWQSLHILEIFWYIKVWLHMLDPSFLLVYNINVGVLYFCEVVVDVSRCIIRMFKYTYLSSQTNIDCNHIQKCHEYEMLLFTPANLREFACELASSWPPACVGEVPSDSPWTWSGGSAGAADSFIHSWAFQA